MCWHYFFVLCISVLAIISQCRGLQQMKPFNTNGYAIECKDKRIGHKIPDFNDCTGYILCHGRMWIQEYCAAGSIFNFQLQKCINGTCPPTPTPKPTTIPTSPSTPTSTPTPTTPTKTTTPTPSTTPAINCANKPYGYKIPVYNDCMAYILCQGKAFYKQFCEVGKKFDFKQQNCVNGSCAPKPSSNCLNQPHGTIIPDLYHCRFFWQCVKGNTIMRFCEIGKWFDRKRYVCNYPKEVTNCPAKRD